MDSLKSIYEQCLEAAAVFGKAADDMVYGEGDAKAKLMLIGEAPGAEETKLKRPFVGKAGKNLDDFLAVIGQRRESIYISNVVKFRPFKVSAKGRLSNRPPKSGEVSCMLPHLLEEIEAVAPRVVVTLGNCPLRAVLGDKKAVIGGCHAQPAQAKALSHAFWLFPLYHPASIIYNRALAPVYAQDLSALKRYIDGLD